MASPGRATNHFFSPSPRVSQGLDFRLPVFRRGRGVGIEGDRLPGYGPQLFDGRGTG